jgi:hypothetical protein
VGLRRNPVYLGRRGGRDRVAGDKRIQIGHAIADAPFEVHEWGASSFTPPASQGRDRYAKETCGVALAYNKGSFRIHWVTASVRSMTLGF